MTNGQWTVVVLAAALAAVPLGALLTWPVWSGGSRPRFVPALLAVHTGAAVVLGAVTTGAAVRSWQLVDDPTQHQAAALIQVSRVDGDASLYALLVLLLVGLTGLITLLLALSARFAAADDPTERSIACAVLGLEIGASGYGVALLIGGHTSVPAIAALVHLPLLIAAMVACWPPHPSRDAAWNDR